MDGPVLTRLSRALASRTHWPPTVAFALAGCSTRTQVSTKILWSAIGVGTYRDTLCMPLMFVGGGAFYAATGPRRVCLRAVARRQWDHGHASQRSRMIPGKVCMTHWLVIRGGGPKLTCALMAPGTLQANGSAHPRAPSRTDGADIYMFSPALVFPSASMSVGSRVSSTEQRLTRAPKKLVTSAPILMAISQTSASPARAPTNAAAADAARRATGLVHC